MSDAETEADLIVRHKLDVDDYHRMAQAGILTEDDRVELIHGELIVMSPMGDDHASIVSRLNRVFVRGFGDHAIVSPQNPVHVDRHNEPQPDFTILRPRADFYRSGGATPADVLILIEVSDSSLRFDRKYKQELYSLARIAEYWIVDLRSHAIEVYRTPSGPKYAEQRIYRPGETIVPSLAPDFAFPVDQLIG